MTIASTARNKPVAHFDEMRNKAFFSLAHAPGFSVIAVRRFHLRPMAQTSRILVWCIKWQALLRGAFLSKQASAQVSTRSLSHSPHTG